MHVFCALITTVRQHTNNCHFHLSSPVSKEMVMRGVKSALFVPKIIVTNCSSISGNGLLLHARRTRLSSDEMHLLLSLVNWKMERLFITGIKNRKGMSFKKECWSTALPLARLNVCMLWDNYSNGSTEWCNWQRGQRSAAPIIGTLLVCRCPHLFPPVISLRDNKYWFLNAGEVKGWC